MDLLALEAPLRHLLFGGSFLFTLVISVFVFYDGRQHWPQVLPWLVLGLTAAALTLPALAYSLLGLNVRFQAWMTPLACLGLGGVGLAVLVVSLYAALGRGSAPPQREEPPSFQTEAHERGDTPRPHFQRVCRNPVCRAPLEATVRLCPVCGWDQGRPVPTGKPPVADTAHPDQPVEKLAYLAVRDGPQAGTSFRLGLESVIGSGVKAHVSLRDPFVAGEHAVIRFKTSAYVFYDMSTDGSYLITPDDRQRIDVPHTLRHGDLIEVGHTLLVFMQAG